MNLFEFILLYFLIVQSRSMTFSCWLKKIITKSTFKINNSSILPATPPFLKLNNVPWLMQIIIVIWKWVVEVFFTFYSLLLTPLKVIQGTKLSLGLSAKVSTPISCRTCWPCFEWAHSSTCCLDGSSMWVSSMH